MQEHESDGQQSWQLPADHSIPWGWADNDVFSEFMDTDGLDQATDLLNPTSDTATPPDVVGPGICRTRH
jgi:hypothetical protein